MARSIAIIGAGQIGYAAAQAVQGSGCEIAVYARSKPSWLHSEMRFQPYTLGELPAPEADIVIDTIAFDEDDVERYDPGSVGWLVTISSASVYCDSNGRTLDAAAQNGFPDFDRPISEKQTTVAPGPETYSTRKVRMENKVVELFGDRASILRPCAIYGPHSRHPREWWFVKRLLDSRTRIPLLFDGKSQFQTTSAGTLGAAASDAADLEISGVINIADHNAPNVREIGETIAELLEEEIEFVPATGDVEFGVGRTPWSVPKPFVVSGKKHEALLREIRQPYRNDAIDAVQWLRDLNPADWRTAFPQLAAYPWDLFDYEAEDRFFDERL